MSKPFETEPRAPFPTLLAVSIVTAAAVLICTGAEAKTNFFDPKSREKAESKSAPADAWDRSYSQAQAFMNEGKFDQALASSELSLNIAEKEHGPEHERAARSLRAIAQVQVARGNVFQAQIFFDRAIELYKKINGINDVETANTMVQAASLYLGLQRIPEAEELFRTGYEVLRNRYGRTDPRITMAMGGLAETYKAVGDKRAIELFENIIQILSAQKGASDPGIISSYYHLADIYEGIKDYDRAAECYFTIIRILEEEHGIHFWQLSSIYNNLGLVYAKSGRVEEAQKAYRHSLDILVRKHGPDHPEVTTVLENLNSLYVQGAGSVS